MLKRLPGEQPARPVVHSHAFAYEAGCWGRPGSGVAKGEWHRGEWLPRWGVIVTNLRDPTGGIVRFYTGRGTAAPWRKDGQYALHWTRCSCHTCIANQVRLALCMLPDTLGNFLCRLAVPAVVKDRSLRRVQVQPITMGGRLVRHARRVVFPLAAVAVPRGLFQGGLTHIRARTLAPGSCPGAVG